MKKSQFFRRDVGQHTKHLYQHLKKTKKQFDMHNTVHIPLYNCKAFLNLWLQIFKGHFAALQYKSSSLNVPFVCTPNLYDPKVKILPPTFTTADDGRFCEGKGTIQKSISSCNLVIKSRDLQCYLPLIHWFLQSTPSQMNSAFQELQVYKRHKYPF